MTTFAEDMRTMLAEVAPEIAVRVVEPVQKWASYGIRGRRLSRDEYEVTHRAFVLVNARRGRTAKTLCIHCRWNVYVTQNIDVLQHCSHVEVRA